VTVGEGQEFTITLRTNPSTGYHWEPHFNSNALSLTSRTFISDPNPYNLVGVPGSELFTFRSLVKGTTAVTFDNVNPSQVVTAQMVCAVTVT
jgi:predicted secreted protein